MSINYFRLTRKDQTKRMHQSTAAWPKIYGYSWFFAGKWSKNDIFFIARLGYLSILSVSSCCGWIVYLNWGIPVPMQVAKGNSTPNFKLKIGSFLDHDDVWWLFTPRIHAPYIRSELKQDHDVWWCMAHCHNHTNRSTEGRKWSKPSHQRSALARACQQTVSQLSLVKKDYVTMWQPTTLEPLHEKGYP